MVNGIRATAEDIGARHAGEIEYVFGTLDSVPRVTWTDADRTLSDRMMTYWTSFAATGVPSGPGVPTWPAYAAPSRLVLHLDTSIRVAPESARDRFEVLDEILRAR